MACDWLIAAYNDSSSRNRAPFESQLKPRFNAAIELILLIKI
jgi:hypothetical protein